MSQRNNKILNLLKKIHFVIPVSIGIIILILEGIFLYRYFYRSLVHTETLLNLKEQAALEELRTPLYTRLMEFYTAKQKTQPLDARALRDPFELGAPPNPSSTPPNSEAPRQ